MSEPTWAEGYVVDVGYTHGYYRELAPAALSFVTILGGAQAADTDQPFTYYELGCGNGHSCVLHAAANPRGRFLGADFNPTHIHNARRLAQETGVENVQFLEKSFAELTAAELPEAEIIALHGVHSWVSADNRRHIVEFIRQRLKPAGMAYVSYNCLPGLSSIAPLQRLLREHASLGGGALTDGVRRAIEFANRLDEAGAEYFRVNPMAKARLARIGGQDPRYLLHEYFNANWEPSYHTDVARELAGAKLNYVGSADILDNFDQFVLKPEMARIIAGVGDRALAETVKDFARNQVFRRDVFTRGAPKAAPVQLEAMLSRTRFALVRPRSVCSLQGPTPIGEVTLQAEAYAPVLDALARAPMTFEELGRAPECSQLGRVKLRQAIFGMAALGNLLPALPAAGEDLRRDGCGRFNRAVLHAPIAGAASLTLASPVLGAGVPVNNIDRLFLSAPRDEAQAIAKANAVIAATGLKLRKGDKAIDSAAEIEEYVRERAQFFFKDFLPFLKMLGVAD